MKRPGSIARSLALAAWAILLLGLLTGIVVPRWYLLDDWREDLVRGAFWSAVVALPACSIAAVVVGWRADGPDAAAGRMGRRLGIAMLAVVALVLVALVIYVLEIASVT